MVTFTFDLLDRQTAFETWAGQAGHFSVDFCWLADPDQIGSSSMHVSTHATDLGLRSRLRNAQPCRPATCPAKAQHMMLSACLLG